VCGKDPRKVLNGTAVTRETAGTRSEFDLYNDRTETGPAEKLTAFLEVESANRANPAVGSAEKTTSQGGSRARFEEQDKKIQKVSAQLQMRQPRMSLARINP